MKMSMNCPKCGRRHLSIFGVHLKMKAVYNMTGDWITPKKPKGWGAYRKWLKNPNVLFEFYCMNKKCERPFPDSMTKEILEYIKQQRILGKLKEAGKKY